MPNLPTSFRFPFALPEEVPGPVKDALRLTYQGVKDLNDATRALNNKVNTNTTSITNLTAKLAGIASGGISFPTSIGTVNNQSGNTSYEVLVSDFGALIVIDPPSAFALTLDSTFATPFYCVVENLSQWPVMFTPNIGLVNNAASLQILELQSAVVYFDGIKWWVTTYIPPVHDESLTDGNSNFIFAGGDVVTVAGVPN